MVELQCIPEGVQFLGRTPSLNGCGRVFPTSIKVWIICKWFNILIVYVYLFRLFSLFDLFEIFLFLFSLFWFLFVFVWFLFDLFCFLYDLFWFFLIYFGFISFLSEFFTRLIVFQLEYKDNLFNENVNEQ